MTIKHVAAGMILTDGVNSFTAKELQHIYKRLTQIKYERAEPITKKTSLRDAIDIVGRSDSRRQDLAL
ncbi:MAG: hypothetical protein MK132_18455 [Lentisphaerales bacterium]|nr:hypothetical protein [Lentisphaerales bacterium]